MMRRARSDSAPRICSTPRMVSFRHPTGGVAVEGVGSVKDESIERLVLSILPEPDVRQKCLTAFADAIIEANAYGRDKWAVRHARNKVRLHIDHVYICTLENGCVWMSLDKGLLETSNGQSQLEHTGDWRWDTDEYPEYSSIGSRNGYYLPSERHAKVWPVIRRLHFEAIYRAANGRELDAGARENHAPEILMYLRNELERHVPDPLY